MFSLSKLFFFNLIVGSHQASSLNIKLMPKKVSKSSYVKYSPIESIHVYGSVFGLIGVIVAAISIIMLIFRPRLNILIYGNPIKEKSEFIVDQNVQTT